MLSVAVQLYVSVNCLTITAWVSHFRELRQKAIHSLYCVIDKLSVAFFLMLFRLGRLTGVNEVKNQQEKKTEIWYSAFVPKKN